MAQQGPEISKLYTVVEVAAVMRISRMTVYRLIRSSRLRAVRVGRNYRVSEHDLKHYLDTQTVTDLREDR